MRLLPRSQYVRKGPVKRHPIPIQVSLVFLCLEAKDEVVPNATTRFSCSSRDLIFLKLNLFYFFFLKVTKL